MSTSTTPWSGQLAGLRDERVPLLAHEDDVLDAVLAEQREALGRRDEDAHLAVAEDVRELLGLQQRVDRDEHTAGGRRAEHRDDGLDALLEVDRHPLAPAQPEPVQRRAERGDLGPTAPA